jgi:hypothetical protein
VLSFFGVNQLKSYVTDTMLKADPSYKGLFGQVEMRKRMRITLIWFTMR